MSKFQGQGARRRAGESSNMYEAGAPGKRVHKTSDEALQDHAAAGSPRVPMGATAVPPEKGTLVPKKHGKSVDPTNPGSKGDGRTPILAERLGARYAVAVKMPAPFDPAAGPVQAYGRPVSPTPKVTDQFGQGQSGAY